MTRMNGHTRAGLADTLNDTYATSQEFGNQANEFKGLLDTLNKSDFVNAMVAMKGSIIN